MSVTKLGRSIANNIKILERPLKAIHESLKIVDGAVKTACPATIRARPRRIIMAVTAHCNYRCVGCRYGRDFMVGAQLPLELAQGVFSDAAAAGVESIRLYGGEPLLHPKLPAMVSASIASGLSPYVTTNGFLLDRKIDALYAAGLRSLTIGFYGTRESYDRYTGKRGNYSRLIQGLTYLRKAYGNNIDVQLNLLLMRPSCSTEAIDLALEVAREFDAAVQIDLVHYSLPYFTEGPEQQLKFRAEDEERLDGVVRHLLALKVKEPGRLKDDLRSIAAIKDWLLDGPATRVPCDAGDLIWIGADGTVQLCYAAFPLGNLHHQPLSAMIGTSTHHQAAQDAWKLNCPNCHCQRTTRINRHFPSRLKYSKVAEVLLNSAESVAQPDFAVHSGSR